MGGNLSLMHMRVKQVQIILISRYHLSRKSFRFRSCELHPADAHATLQRPNNDFIQKLFYDSARGDFFYVISIELSVILIWRQYNAGREKNSKIGGNLQSRALDDDINDENWKNFVSVFYEFIIIWRAHHQHICPPFSDAWDRWRW